MNTQKIVKEAKIIMTIGIIFGAVLLGLGIVFSIMDVSFISNKRALIGLSLLPFSVAFVYYLKLTGIKKTPEKMKNIIINENDERLVALKNEADAKAFKIVQAAIFLSYRGYTLMVPEDIFESVGWWLLIILLFITFISQGLLAAFAMKRPKSEE
ncbi:MAG TPA: hypothetical protein VLS94_08285 [Fusibacter sp.]|nr:hypothetical protein [Fusibacter sp.]